MPARGGATVPRPGRNFASSCECSSSEQQRHRRKRQPHLLSENPSEQYYVSVMEEEFEGAVHGWARSAITGYFAAKGAVCPQWPAMTNSFMGLRVLGAISRSFKGWGKEAGSPG